MNNFSGKVNFIWSVADLLRGPYRPNQYKDVMLPMTVLRRLDCVLEPTKDKVLAKQKSLSGEEILPEARILCIADVVEAMASHRPYRPALGIDAALEEISYNEGKRYDPEAAKACLGLFREKGFAFDQ